jgi:sec-independent protein translocase protein TatC
MIVVNLLDGTLCPALASYPLFCLRGDSMVDPHDEDDLFKHTSMTFGEHLEELRASLFKAVVALAIGFAIGLTFGSHIVGWIQRPLQNALSAYYQEEAIEYVNQRVPSELRDSPMIADAIYKDGLLPEERYFSPVELLENLREKYPGKFSGIDLQEKPVAAGAEQPGPSSDGAQKSAGQGAVDAARFSKDQMIRMFIWRPLADDERLKVDTLSVQEPFVIYLKASFLAGAVLASPAVFYFLWQFVAAGLYPHEKKYVRTFLPFSVALFLSGAGMAFFLVFPPVLGFFFGIAKSLGAEMRPRLSEWLSFVLLLPLGFGISFQLPLVMLFLERIGVFSVSIYLSKWRIAVLVIAIVSMVLSPGGDPYSMMMMLAPLVGLYFGGIALCKWLPSRRPASVAKKEKAPTSAD